MLRVAPIALLAGVLLASAPAIARLAPSTPDERRTADDEARARSAAEAFGRALAERDSPALAATLPRAGRVRLRLERLVGDEKGFYSSAQVLALVRTFLQEGSVDAFRVTSVESTTGNFVRVEAAAEITNHKGVVRPSALTLTLEREEGRWVVRELRETPS